MTGELLGYDSIMRLNATGFERGENPTEVEQAIVSIAGPVITVLQAFFFFQWLRKKAWSKYIYLFLFTPFYCRFLASIMNLLNLNDEGRVSNYLGLGTFTIPLLVSGVLFYLVYRISKQNNLTWRFQLATTLIIMLFSSILILADMFFRIQLL